MPTKRPTLAPLFIFPPNAANSPPPTPLSPSPTSRWVQKQILSTFNLPEDHDHRQLPFSPYPARNPVAADGEGVELESEKGGDDGRGINAEEILAVEVVAYSGLARYVDSMRRTVDQRQVGFVVGLIFAVGLLMGLGW